MPRMSGPASGLLKAVCSISPDADSESPARMAVSVEGILDCRMMKSQLSLPVVPPVRTDIIFLSGICTVPMQRFADMRIRIAIDSVMQTCRAWILITSADVNVSQSPVYSRFLSEIRYCVRCPLQFYHRCLCMAC